MANMRLAMVVSLVDKLTAPAKKVIATVKGVGGKFDDTARMAKDASGALRGAAAPSPLSSRSALQMA